jgi:hypothetical protein
MTTPTTLSITVNLDETALKEIVAAYLNDKLNGPTVSGVTFNRREGGHGERSNYSATATARV